MMKTMIVSFGLFCLALPQPSAQTVKADLSNSARWDLHNRERVPNSDKATVEMSKAPGDGMMILKDSKFLEGVLEFIIKGENRPGESFVGIAFNVQDDKHYEAIYFRPFNFLNKERRSHSVQYISMPDHPWEQLRSGFPGKYENALDPAPDPDGWFRAKVVITGKMIRVFVNDAPKPSLEVESLVELNTARAGAIGLWVGNYSKGSFKDLKITSAKPAAGSK